MKDKLITAFLVFIILIGVSVLLYPTISNYLNEQNQASAIIQYDAMLSEISEEVLEKCYEASVMFNEKVAEDYFSIEHEEELKDYENVLDVTGTGIMGYVTIPKLGVSIAIYHGTEESVLQTSVGHMRGTSLPVGGESTHAVLVGHRGLPSAKLFSDLDKIEIGDEFSVAVLNYVMTYQVDQIVVVEPDQVDQLRVKKGEDYCTLLTCTPYGINTHRLLIRGKRVVDTTKEEPVKQVYVTGNAIPISTWITVAVLASPLLIILFLIVAISLCRHRDMGGKNDTEEQDRQ